ncbi:MAG: response regulator transcription factor [Lachnospiraceae bacterium]|nr:response regulator transcription factor [Lachnospiraceae bacterium]
MIKIAVCDDEPVICEQLKQMVASKLKQWDEPFQIACYTNAVQFFYMPLDYDLIFLDIRMPNLNGMELAKKLREKDFEGVLIFVTVLEEYMPDAFEVEAMDYLLKPVEEARLERTLKRSLKHLSVKEEKGLFVRTMNWCQNIKLKDIYYCEVINRKIYLHTKKGILDYYGKMKEVEQQTAPDFIRCHRSFLVNPAYLSEYRNGQAVLENGEQIPVSKNYHSDFMKKMMDYIGKEE